RRRGPLLPANTRGARRSARTAAGGPGGGVPPDPQRPGAGGGLVLGGDRAANREALREADDRRIGNLAGFHIVDRSTQIDIMVICPVGALAVESADEGFQRIFG